MKASVIIFYKEDRGWLGDCIKAAEDQTFDKSDYEIIIQQGEASSAVNFNNGVKRATGEYIKGCAEDDLLTPNCLADMVMFADLHGVDVVVANAINFYPEGNEVLYESFIPATVSKLAEYNTIHGGAVLYRRSALIDVGLMREDLHYAEEFDLNLRLAQAGYRFGYLDKVVFRYRMHDRMKSMQTKVSSAESYISRRKAIRTAVVDRYINEHRQINICKASG